MKYVPCNTVEKLCPLPRPRRRLRRPPRPLGARAAGKQPGSARGLAALLAPVHFPGPGPPDRGPAHTIVRNPSGAPARGTRLPRGRGQGRLTALGGMCCQGAGEGLEVVAGLGTARHLGKGCWWGLGAQDCCGTTSSASTPGLWWWRASLILCNSVLCGPSTEGNKILLLFIINICYCAC